MKTVIQFTQEDIHEYQSMFGEENEEVPLGVVMKVWKNCPIVLEKGMIHRSQRFQCYEPLKIDVSYTVLWELKEDKQKGHFRYIEIQFTILSEKVYVVGETSMVKK